MRPYLKRTLYKKRLVEWPCKKKLKSTVKKKKQKQPGRQARNRTHIHTHNTSLNTHTHTHLQMVILKQELSIYFVKI
jgi:hypothetical protein